VGRGFSRAVSDLKSGRLYPLTLLRNMPEA